MIPTTKGNMIPSRDNPQLKAFEARLAAAAKEIEAVVTEAEQLWPDERRRWSAIFVAGMPERSYLFHERIPESPKDE